MYFQYMCRIKYGIQVLEERVIDDLEPDAEMVAQGVENASTLYFWRIRGDFIIIVAIDFSIDVIFVEQLAFFALNEEQVQEVHKAILELLDQLVA